MQTQATPPRVMGLYDRPFWAFLDQERSLRLQRCDGCGTFRYPPGPACHVCLSPDSTWTPIGGGAEILSWIVFHRTYLDPYKAPYNVIAVRLDEGPTMISNLIGPQPQGSWIGQRVSCTLQDMEDSVVLPRFRIVAGD